MKNDVLKKSIKVIFLLIIVFIIGCGPAFVRKHPDFAEIKKDIQCYTVIPVEYDVKKLLTLNQTKSMPEKSKEMSLFIQKSIQNDLMSKGYDCDIITFSNDTSSLSPELIETVNQLRREFETINTKIRKNEYKPGARKNEFLYELGPEINKLIDHSKADALIFVKGSGMIRSGGSHSKEFLKALVVGVASGGALAYRWTLYTAQIQLAFVDINSGEVLWYNFHTGEVNPTSKTSIKSLIKNLLKKFPSKNVPDKK